MLTFYFKSALASSFFPGWFQAKALAEKNMRDLLAQKEQQERNVRIEMKEAQGFDFIVDLFFTEAG